jgi:hypothetical protein
MAIDFHEGVALEHPSRTGATVLGSDQPPGELLDEPLIQLDQDVVGVSGSMPQFATVRQAVDLAILVLHAVRAALTPGPV